MNAFTTSSLHVVNLFTTNSLRSSLQNSLHLLHKSGDGIKIARAGGWSYRPEAVLDVSMNPREYEGLGPTVS